MYLPEAVGLVYQSVLMIRPSLTTEVSRNGTALFVSRSIVNCSLWCTLLKATNVESTESLGTAQMMSSTYFLIKGIWKGNVGKQTSKKSSITYCAAIGETTE